MTKTNHYKNLWKEQKEETRKLKIQLDKMLMDLERNMLTILNQKDELKRIRRRKWWQFWKFFKRNRII